MISKGDFSKGKFSNESNIENYRYSDIHENNIENHRHNDIHENNIENHRYNDIHMNNNFDINLNNHSDLKIKLNDKEEIIPNFKSNRFLSKNIFGERFSRDVKFEDTAQRITLIILAILKKESLKEYIYTRLKNAYPKEVQKIYELSLKVFNEKEIFLKETIFMRVCDYISENNYIDINGFIQFRMKDFMKYMTAIVDIGLEEYLIQRDHEEFIKVLKQFVELQEEKIDLLKVKIMKDNSFILYDKNNQKIESIDDEEIINLIIKENLNYEDFLISTMLSLCPRKVEITDNVKSKNSKEIINTLKEIFEGRVSEEK
ncbi:MAG: putative sporulation protein YtxC [Clostridioides sp.]|nr:putative sporulation protein YtxC [Clostridioides sp.]